MTSKTATPKSARRRSGAKHSGNANASPTSTTTRSSSNSNRSNSGSSNISSNASGSSSHHGRSPHLHTQGGPSSKRYLTPHQLILLVLALVLLSIGLLFMFPEQDPYEAFVKEMQEERDRAAAETNERLALLKQQQEEEAKRREEALQRKIREDQLREQRLAQKQLEDLCQGYADTATKLVLENNVTDVLDVVHSMANIIEGTQKCPAATKQEIYEDLGEFCTHMQLFNLAVPVRKLILAMPSLSEKERLIHRSALAQDLYYDHKYDDSLKLVSELLEEHGAALPDASKRILLTLQSQAYECKGDYVTSLHVLETAMNVGTAPPNLALMHLHYDLLSRVQEVEDIPAEVRAMMAKRLADAGDVLLRIGPWLSTMQMPAKYIRGLHARPWHEFASHPDLEKYKHMLEMRHKALAFELEGLINEKLLSSEHECIHERGGGNWFKYEINGYWNPLDPATKCSVQTPIACDLIEGMKASGLRVVRAGYSALEANTVLKPHYGMTNAQLKFHLGLHVPTRQDGTPCAKLTVGHETRSWKAGRVLFFDDSFRHSAVNHCGTIRSVFQVVFVHPDLDDDNVVKQHFAQQFAKEVGIAGQAH